MRSGLEQGSSVAGGNFNYGSGELDGRGYIPLSSRLVIALRARYSRLLYGQALPITRRYFAGGSSSHRGFPQRRISPIINDDSAGAETGIAFIGGDERLESSVELRLDVWPILDDWFGVVGFVDAGDVSESKNNLKLNNLHTAVGFGLRIGTPIGPIRADFGIRMNRFNQANQLHNGRYAFHLGIGEAF